MPIYCIEAPSFCVNLRSPASTHSRKQPFSQSLTPYNFVRLGGFRIFSEIFISCRMPLVWKLEMLAENISLFYDFRAGEHGHVFTFWEKYILSIFLE